jgi:type I restriction enzyme S subunit
LPPGTILLSSRAPIGYLAITQVPVAINQGFIAIKCNEQIPNYYILHWAKENMEAIIGRANGTTFLEISKANFRPMLITIPPVDLTRLFVEQVDPLYKEITTHLREIRTIALLRDALLPQLLSGEIRITDAGRFLEAGV